MSFARLVVINRRTNTPGVYVTRIVQAVERVKDIEQRTTRPRPEGAPR